MPMGFYFDQTRCTGCHTCTVACKDWHDVPAGPASWIQVKTIEKGSFPEVSVAFLPVFCLHCAVPLCATACPAEAIAKREDGIVVVNGEKCLGRDSCGMLCRDACPYGIPQFGSEENAKMQMCNFCLDRLAEDRKPTCVSACPMRALDAAPLDELKSKYGDVKEAEGFVYSAEAEPSIIFKAKRSAAP